jgi:hypothetical protein
LLLKNVEIDEENVVAVAVVVVVVVDSREI